MSTARFTEGTDATNRVPRVLRVGAALSWRLLVVLAAIAAIAYVFSYLAIVVIPVAIALLLSALLAPAVAHLVKWHVPRGLATAAVLIGGLAVVGGVLTFVITEFSNGVPALATKVSQSISQISNWLETGPLHLSQQQLRDFLNKLVKSLGADQTAITSGALTTAVTVGETLTAILLTLFTLIFFLHGGNKIWSFVIGIVPADVRDRVDVAGRRGFASLVSYVRATAAVAVVDAVGIGVGIAIVRVPLAVPLAALVFLAAFIPIVGAVVAGSVAVLVALVANGFVPALIVLGIVIAVMQLESHILQPLLLGRAVRLHPLAVVLSIATGVIVGGIAGGLLAVPLLAVLNSGIRSLLHDPPLVPTDVDALLRSEARPIEMIDEDAPRPAAPGVVEVTTDTNELNGAEPNGAAEQG
ncbi:MAG TPA: AI-2E family transporter [Pseudonocardiaceae bacterium]|nr:AI-2E family transporter [Pseudonocardiaceae bacterium]